jgi:hypothetical protein
LFFDHDAPGSKIDLIRAADEEVLMLKRLYLELYTPKGG